MKTLAAVTLFASALCAQSSVYPGSIDGNPQLFVAADNVQSVLNVAMQVSDSVAIIASTTGFSVNMIATICDAQTAGGKCTAWEHMLITGISGANTLQVTRAFAGTSAVSHRLGLNVSALIDAAHHSALSGAVQAIENALGANLSNVLAGSVYSAKYVWTQTPGGTLTGGVGSTVNLSPCPVGVSGANGLYSVRIAGGTGGSEAVLVTGGTCTSGAGSGTLVFTPANNHSAAWTIGTATAGIAEAVYATSLAGGGTVQVEPGIHVIHGATGLPSNVCIVGAGRATSTLQVAAGEFSNIPAWRFGFNPSGVVIAGEVGTSRSCVMHLTIDMQGSTQLSPPNGSYAIELINVNNAVIADTEVLNGPILTGGNTFLPYGILGTSANNLASGNFVTNLVCTISGQGAGGFIVSGTANRVVNSYVGNGCNSSFVATGNGAVFDGNVFNILGSTQVAASQAFAADNSTNTTFSNNVCIGNNTGPACFAATADAASPPTANTAFSGNIAINCGQAFQISSNASAINGVSISGGAVSGCATNLALAGGGGNNDYSVRGVTGWYNGSADSVNDFLPVVSGANQNVAIGSASTIRPYFPGTPGAYSLGGFAGGFDGRRLTVINTTAQALTVTNIDAGSSVGNRIDTGTGATLTVRLSISFEYSLQDAVWIVTAIN